MEASWNFAFESSKQLAHGWMDDLRFYVLFNSILVISGQRKVDNERLCAMELRLRLRRFRLDQESNSVATDVIAKFENCI